MCKYTAPPPRHWQFEGHVGYSPPTLRNFLPHCLYFSWGLLWQLICYTAEGVSRNDERSGHWTGCAVTPELQPVFAL